MTPKNKSGGGKGPPGRHDFCSEDTGLVKNLQLMPVTPDCDPGIYGLDKDGGTGTSGSLPILQ